MPLSQPGTPYDTTWAAQRHRAIHRAAVSIAKHCSASTRQRESLQIIADSLRPVHARVQSGLHVHLLPLLVYAAWCRDDVEAVPLAALMALLMRGAGIIDDLADEDPVVLWPEYTHAEMNLGGIELLSLLPHLVIADLRASPTTILSMHRAVTRSLMRAFSGQRQDLALRDSQSVTLAEAEDCAAAKAGELIALGCTLPAIFAGADSRTVSQYARFGRLLGTAQSIAEDVIDLFCKEQSSDLRTGTRSFPIACHLERLCGSSREEFLLLLARAQTEVIAQRTVRECLVRSGEIQYCALIVAEYCVAARRVLARLKPPAPVHRAMLQVIDSLPLVRPMSSAPVAAAAKA